MKKTLAALLLLATSINWAFGRLIAHWPYEKLYKEADWVAVVELESTASSDQELLGYGDSAQYQGKIAQLNVGVILKGNRNAKKIRLRYFVYSETVPAMPNGALFINFSDSEKYLYLMFLKKEAKRETYVPVSGHYDAAISMKKILKDPLSPMIRAK